MRDLQTLEAKKARADRIRDFIEREGLTEYRDKARSQLVERMVATEDAEKRERLAVAVKTFDKFWEYVGDILAGGQLAERDLREIETGRRSFF